MATYMTVAFSLLKLASFLLLLPALLTYWHLRSTGQNQSLILLSPPVNEKQQLTTDNQQLPDDLPIFGVYRQAFLVDGAFERIIPIDSYSIWSIVRLTAIFARAPSTKQNVDLLQFQDPQNRCFSLATEKWCSRNRNESHHDKRLGSLYEHIHDGKNGSKMRPPVQVTPILRRHREGSSSSSWWRGAGFNWRIMLGLGPSDFRLNPNRLTQQQGRQPPHPLGELFLHRPATTLLIALNVALAFLYWNRQVSPHAVAENYHAIVQKYEWWRCWTGALAHFDLWHIGFNMMTLHALGRELEPRYGSIPFLFYNLSLMPITTAIFIGIGYLQQQQQHRAVSINLGNPTLQSMLSVLSTAGDTVGYSGVLFAWLVVASLEQEATCPISFVPQMCFRTHAMRGFKFSWAPWVSLVVTQMILPKRVSLVGHLSGILAGFLLHWNAFPLEIFQPCVLVPYTLVIGQWWLARRMIPIPKAANGEDIDIQQLSRQVINDAELEAPNEGYARLIGGSGCQRYRPDRLRQLRRHDQFQRLLETFRVFMAIVLLGNIFVVKMPYSSILLSFGGAMAIFHFAVCSHARLCSSNFTDLEEKERLSTIWRGFVVVGILTIIADSMTLSGVALLFWNLAGTRHTVSVAVLLLRADLLLVTVSIACYSLHQLDATDVVVDSGGVFAVTFGNTVLQPACAIGQAISCAACGAMPFQGHGITLGSTRSDSREISPLL